MYNAFLFDLDGTLVDTAPDLHEALNHVLEKNDFRCVDLNLTRHWVGHGAMAMLSSALEQLGKNDVASDVLETMYQEFLSYYGSHISDLSEPYEGVVDTLNHFYDSGTPLGVVTNKRWDLSLQLLQELDLYKYLDVLVGGDTLQVQKPAAEPALYACNELNAEPSSTLFVGDSETDVKCARAAGCTVAVVRYGYNQGHPVEVFGADRIIDSLRDLR